MIRIGFWFDRPQEYTGGLHYIKNLLHALSIANDGTIEPYVFFGARVDARIIEQFSKLANVVRTPVLDRGRPSWLLHKLLMRFWGRMWVANHWMRRHRIDLVSHAEHLYGPGRSYRMISWLPDFQYLHLPELFPTIDTAVETRRLLTLADGTDAILLSSHAAFKDFASLAPPAVLARTSVLQFVSQPGAEAVRADPSAGRGLIEEKYGFRGPYFFLPNQFWAHKNHKVVFEAVAWLKREGVEVLVVCTGNLRDYRLKDQSYADGLRDYIESHSLQPNIRILGLIDYQDVLTLMRLSLAVLNPSRFEGWSSTVEESRSMGKRLVLSQIPVHLEQDPPGAAYFPPDDPAALAQILKEIWLGPPQLWSAEVEAQCRLDLQERTLRYGQGYLALVKKVMQADAD